MRRLRRSARMLLVNGLGSGYWFPKTWRRVLYRACGLDINDATVFSGTIIRTARLRIGSGSFVNHFCLFDDGDITIGRSVFISSGVTLASMDHEMGPSSKRAGPVMARPIVIEDGAWIGARAVVLGGVTIARGCVIGAGAVVTRSTEPNSIYAGVPARLVRVLQDVG